MNRIVISILFAFCVCNLYSQNLSTVRTPDWNSVYQSGFYEGLMNETLNNPSTGGWYWGINTAHTSNTTSYRYNGQILFKINLTPTEIPLVYVRSTDKNGDGIWARLLHDKGDQNVNGNLRVNNNLIIRNNDDNSAGWGEYGGRLTFGDGANMNSDMMYISRYNISKDKSELRVNIGDDSNDKFIVGRHNFSDAMHVPMLVVSTVGNGRVGIGGMYDPRSALDVKGEVRSDALTVAGTIKSRVVEIEVNAGADFVFEPTYNLKPLSEVETFVNENKHLPDIPSEQEMKENGLNLNEMQIKLLQKIEELTLYVIEQNKKIEELQNKVDGKK
ncbi:MAG: hypothetical protein QM660_06945 [Dysgonomonas sp.]